MGTFIVKLMTVFGFVLYSGGPIDALEKWVSADSPADRGQIVRCAPGNECGSVVRLALTPDHGAPVLRSSVGDLAMVSHADHGGY